MLKIGTIAWSCFFLCSVAFIHGKEQPSISQSPFEEQKTPEFRKKHDKHHHHRKGFCHLRDSVRLNGEFLYWVSNHTFPYSLERNQQKFSSYSKNYPAILLNKRDNKWSPGFRANVGYSFANEIDLQLIATDYTQSTHFSSSIEEPGVTFNGLSCSSFGLKYRIGDIEIGKGCYFKKVMFRPFFCVRGIWLQQEEKLSFPALLPLWIEGAERPIFFQHQLHEKWLIVGPRIGVNSEWFRFRYFSFLANLSVSLLYGEERFKSSSNYRAIESAEDLGEREGNCSSKNNIRQLFPQGQLFLGTSWAYCFSKRSSIRFYVGWESNVLWGSSRILCDLSPTSKWEEVQWISLCGGSAGISLNF